MKWAFLISGIVELLAGIMTYQNPSLLFIDIESTFRFYGLSISVLGIINLLCFKYFEEQGLCRSIYMSMMFFHAVVAVLSYRASGLIYPTEALATHLGLFGFLVLMYMRDLKPTSKRVDNHNGGLGN